MQTPPDSLRAEPLASIPGNERVYVVGDIHGRLDLLTRMASMIEKDAAQHKAACRKIIFLGDYIDRGPSSKGVIDYLLQGFGSFAERVFLRGNHEEFLLRLLGGDYAAGPAWLRYGGLETLLSYGITPSALNPFDWEAVHCRLLEIMPPAHLEFLKATRLFYTLGGYLFVHAGIRPGIALDKQSRSDLLQIRDEFLEASAPHEKIVVHGHSIAAQPEIRGNRIGIDTGAFATGHLTCLVLQDTDKTFLST